MFNNKWNPIQTWKYVLHADSTTLCAFKCFPSAANVTSTNDSLFNKLENMEMKFGWWLFHLKQNCCTAISVKIYVIIVRAQWNLKSNYYNNRYYTITITNRYNIKWKVQMLITLMLTWFDGKSQVLELVLLVWSNLKFYSCENPSTEIEYTTIYAIQFTSSRMCYLYKYYLKFRHIKNMLFFFWRCFATWWINTRFLKTWN